MSASQGGDQDYEAEVLVEAFEASVAEVIQAFVADPNQPVFASSVVRQVLLQLEDLLRLGLRPATTLVREDDDRQVTGPTLLSFAAFLDPLWDALKHVRLSGSLEECGLLERLLSETDALLLPKICLEHGWGWTRAFLIACLNQHVLHTFLESLLADGDLLVRAYTTEAPLRRPTLRTRVVAVTAALNGCNFQLEHWSAALLEQGTSGDEVGVKQELQVRHGAVSPSSYLLQAMPLTSVRLPAREQHVTEVEVTAATPVLVWQWDLEYYDVGFVIIRAQDGQELAPAARHSASGRMVEGLCECSSEGKVVLKWDNSYSVRRSKRIRYRVAAVSMEAKQAAEQSSAESLRAAIWRCLAERAAPGLEASQMDLSASQPPPLEVNEDAPKAPPLPSPPTTRTLVSSTSTVLEDQKALPEPHLPSGGETAVVASGGGSGGAVDAFWSYLSTFTETLVGQQQADRANQCGICDEEFGLFRRSHRCRMCQGTYCLPCSRHHVTLQGKPNQRVCTRCLIQLRDQRAAASTPPPRPRSLSCPSPLSPSTGGGADSLSPPPPLATSPIAQSPYDELKADPELSRFFRMLKMGVPASAVAQKMMTEGVEQRIINIFLAGPRKGGKSQQESSGAAEEEEDAAVGLSSSGTARTGTPSSSLPGGSNTRRASVRSGRGIATPQSSMRLRSVYWEELAPDKAEKSLFRRRSSVAQSMGQDVAAIALPAEDVKDLAQLFSAKASTAPATNTAEGGKAVAGGRKTPPKASVIDGRRLQNVGIISSFFRRAFPSMDDMVRSVLTLNRDRIPVERVSGLIEVMPTPEEQKKLLPLRAQATQLSEAEQFMLSMMKVPRMGEKVRSYQHYLSFMDSARMMEQKVDGLLRTCRDVMSSDRLVRVLEVLLLIGNTMNAYSGSSTGTVQAFKIDSLFQVVLTKSTHQNTTLLDYFVRLAAEKGEGDILNMGEDMPTLALAVNLPDTSSLGKELRLWLREHDHVRLEVQREHKELEGYRQARIERKEARRRAKQEKLEAERRAEEERRMAAQRALEEQERKRKEDQERAAHRAEVKRALGERVRMEAEDGRRWQGQHFFAFVSEAEAEYASQDPHFLKQLCVLLGFPPLPLPLADRLHEGESHLDGVRRINHELGGVDGEDQGQQSILRLASRWLAAHTRLSKILDAIDGGASAPSAPSASSTEQQPPGQAVNDPPPPTPASEPPPAPKLPALPAGLGGGRGALLASLSAGGGLKALKKRGGPGGALGSSSASSAFSPRTPTSGGGDEEDEDLRVDFEEERCAYVKALAKFLADTEAQVAALSERGKELEERARELFVYFGEEPSTASSSSIFTTLSRFLTALRSAREAYERRHGKILTPSMLEELSFLVVGQRVATVLGVGVVEAVKVRDRTVVCRLPFGIAYLRDLSVIIKVGARVSTPVGPGTVTAIRSIVGVYEVQLDWGARLFAQPSQIRAASRK